MRALREHEKPLVKAAFAAAGIPYSEHLRVREIDDGGMGSLLFLPGGSIKQFGIAKLYFLDEDEVLVSAELNATAEGKPVELDVWKVDFSQLRRWPDDAEILEDPPGGIDSTNRPPD